MRKEEPKSKTLKRSIALSLLFSFSIIAIILYFTVDEQTLLLLEETNVNVWYFVLAVLMNFFYWILWGARLKILADCIEKPYRIKWWNATKIVMANMFLANITPSMAGGEPVRIYLLNKDGLSVGSATAAVFGERLLDAMFLLLCFPVAFFIIGSRIDILALRIAIGIAAVIFILILVAFALAMKYPEKIKALSAWLCVKVAGVTKRKDHCQLWIERINVEIDRFHGAMISYLTKAKRPLIGAFVLTASFWIIGWTIPSLILKGLGLDFWFIESCAAQVLIIIIAMMPTTPGSAGVTEGGLAGLYATFISSSMIGVFIVLYRFATYFFGLIVGAFFQYKVFKGLSSFSSESLQADDEDS